MGARQAGSDAEADNKLQELVELEVMELVKVFHLVEYDVLGVGEAE